MAERTFRNAAFNNYIFKALKDERYVPLEPLLGEIRQPVLVIWGDHDRVLDVSSVDVMRPLLPQAEFVVMQNTGLFPTPERPAKTAAYCLEFLDGL